MCLYEWVSAWDLLASKPVTFFTNKLNEILHTKQTISSIKSQRRKNKNLYNFRLLVSCLVVAFICIFLNYLYIFISFIHWFSAFGTEETLFITLLAATATYFIFLSRFTKVMHMKFVFVLFLLICIQNKFISINFIF